MHITTLPAGTPVPWGQDIATTSYFEVIGRARNVYQGKTFVTLSQRRQKPDSYRKGFILKHECDIAIAGHSVVTCCKQVPTQV